MPNTSTPYQSQYLAWLLSRRMSADSADLLPSTLVDAQAGLNPHQVEAALFAFQNPLSKGVILGYFDAEVQKLDAWADDDYSLNVANLPMAQKVAKVLPPQHDLFGGDVA